MLLLLIASLLAVAAGGKGSKGGNGGRGEVCVCALHATYFALCFSINVAHMAPSPQYCRRRKRDSDGIFQAAQEEVVATMAMKRSSFRWVCPCVWLHSHSHGLQVFAVSDVCSAR
jgi:hypothetical protein